MSCVPPDPADSSGAPIQAPDDTAAFSRFYLGDPEAQPVAPRVSHSLVYRLFVGWWR